MKRVQDRVAIITGAAQGIGATYAKAMAKEGATVVIADLDDGESVASQIRAGGGEAIKTKHLLQNWHQILLSVLAGSTFWLPTLQSLENLKPNLSMRSPSMNGTI